ncbi:MAG: hypothetical protein KAJ55_04655 [Anaerolineales bacterium]|nr:hypothetical protein [Anaerolineales bacterium]
MPNGPHTTPFIEALTVPVENCVPALNDLLALRSEDYVLIAVIPCPGKNWVGSRRYHWLIVWRPKLPSP